MKVLVALLVLVAVVGYPTTARPAALPIVGCGGDLTDLKVVSIRVLTSPECTVFPCSVKRGDNVTLVVDFKNEGATDLADLENKVYGIIAGISVPFPGFPKVDVDVCKLNSTSSDKCPVKKGDEYVEKLTLPVISSAPKLTVTAKWELVEPTTSKIEGCFEALLKLT